MRNMALHEMNLVSGGATDGYNLSFIVSNTVGLAIIGWFLNVNPYACAAAGAAYGAAMLAAKLGDSYFKLDEPHPQVTKAPTPITPDPATVAV